jgi:hypothetical protein
MQIKKTDQRLNDFYEAIQRGKEALEDAGRILVAMIDEDASVKERIMDDHPEITEDVLETFERIGRKQLYYRLCLLEAPGIRALKRCPYSEQVRFETEPLPMLLINGKDLTDHLLVAVHSMQPDQVRQVFGAHRIRSLAEQRAWLENQKCKPRQLENSNPYTIGKGRITFHEPVTLSASDMARLLAEITAH